MGKLFQSTCYASDTEALVQVCAASYPKFAGSASAPSVTTCQPSATGLTLTTSDGTNSTTAALSVPLQDCDPLLEYQDLTVLFGALLAAVLTVYLVKQFIYRFTVNQ